LSFEIYPQDSQSSVLLEGNIFTRQKEKLKETFYSSTEVDS